jgi:hypothetical protein
MSVADADVSVWKGCQWLMLMLVLEGMSVADADVRVGSDVGG